MQRLINEDAFIDSVECVAALIKDETGETIKGHVVRRVMKDMDLKYKKVHHIPLAGNKPRALILRQQWAKRFLQQPRGTIVIFIDETWVNQTDFRRAKWQPSGTNSSVPAFSMAPRVTMVVGVGSDGAVYLSLA